MTHPQSPWTLQGYSLQTVNMLDVEPIQHTLPDGIKIVSIFPGKTLGGVYVACYHEGSTLLYSELIVVGAIVQAAGKVGSWISQIYVDNPDSVEGGRAIWGLPKQLARFEWDTKKGSQVRVYQDQTLLCELSCGWKLPGWQQTATLPVFSTVNSDLVVFEGQVDFKFHLANIGLNIPSQSPFSKLGLSPSLAGFYFDPLHLVAHTPYPLPDIGYKQAQT